MSDGAGWSSTQPGTDDEPSAEPCLHEFCRGEEEDDSQSVLVEETGRCIQSGNVDGS